MKSGDRFELPDNSHSHSVMLKCNHHRHHHHSINIIMDPNIPPPPKIDRLLALLERYLTPKGPGLPGVERWSRSTPVGCY